MKRIFTLAASLASLAVLAMPEVQDLSVSQNNNRMVAISFTLSEKAIVTMDITTNGVSIGADNYRTVRDAMANDDVFPANKIVAAGQHLWTWRPTKEWPGFYFGSNEFAVKVQAWSFDNPPDYMVINGNIVSNVPSFYAKVEDLPNGGIKTADPSDAEAVAALASDVYRTSRLVLRKIPAAGVKWRMGSPTDESYRQSNETPHYVTLTNDYYVSIYPLTFSQVMKFFNTADAASVNPKYNLAYKSSRGDPAAGYSWPENGHDVSPSSYFGYMRNRTGFRFDFLTEAEWEYACRAGTEGRWNHDGNSPDAVAWTGYTSGAKGHTVGIKQPNAWGLYDMHGLVQEWVLDQYGEYPEDAVVAPDGATDNASNRVLRGGPKAVKVGSSYDKSPQISTRSAYRTSDAITKQQDGNNNGYGARVSCPAALPDWLR